MAPAQRWSPGSPGPATGSGGSAGDHCRRDHHWCLGRSCPSSTSTQSAWADSVVLGPPQQRIRPLRGRRFSCASATHGRFSLADVDDASPYRRTPRSLLGWRTTLPRASAHLHQQRPTLLGADSGSQSHRRTPPPEHWRSFNRDILVLACTGGYGVTAPAKRRDEGTAPKLTSGSISVGLGSVDHNWHRGSEATDPPVGRAQHCASSAAIRPSGKRRNCTQNGAPA